MGRCKTVTSWLFSITSFWCVLIDLISYAVCNNKFQKKKKKNTQITHYIQYSYMIVFLPFQLNPIYCNSKLNPRINYNVDLE